MREKTEKILIAALLVSSVIFGFVVTEPFAVMLYGFLCLAASLFYLVAAKTYERATLIKVAAFVSITIGVFSFFGLVLAYTEDIYRLILTSGFDKPTKIAFFHFVSWLTAVVVSLPFAPIAFKVSGRFWYVYLACGAIFPMLIQEFWCTIVLGSGVAFSFLLYRLLALKLKGSPALRR